MAELLAPVPSGTVQRALSTIGTGFERHVLVCTYSAEVLDAGLATRWAEAERVADLLAGARGFATNYRVEPGPAVLVSCDYVPGRTLAQVLDKVREDQIPLGVDHALTVLQSTAQALILMHEKGIQHGSLSPHSLWISYEGSTLILDAPVGALIQPLAAKIPALRSALGNYRPVAAASAFQQDVFALGAILYELLTLAPLPSGPALRRALSQATFKAAQEDGPMPKEMQQLLERMLLVEQPFGTAAEFSAALERVLYEGEFSPTTFNMAFLMHTLFRDEQEADTRTRKQEQNGNYARFLPEAGALAKPARSGSIPYLVAGGVLVVVAAFGAMLYTNHQNNQQFRQAQAGLEAKLAAFRQEKEANDAKLADIAKQEQRQKSLEQMFGQQAKEGNTEAVRVQAKKDLESAQKKARQLAEDRAEALYYSQQLAAKEKAAKAGAPVQ
jgi:hypothetical protein